MFLRSILKFVQRGAFLVLLTTASVSAQTYDWKNVQIKGGGLVSGLIYSKAETDLLYARTDVGGAYRWNAPSKTWTPITDGLTSADDWGIWSLAADPTNANKVYIATGLYSASWGNNGSIYGSDDKGATWTKLASLPFKLGGNDPGRGTCERLVVDPNKSSVLYLGSKKDGLYKSTDSGKNWAKVSSLSASYITFVEFDKSTGSSGNATPTIYVGVADYIYNNGNVGVYRSTDGGTTWNKLTNHPTTLAPKSFAPGNNALTTVPTKIAIASGNTIYFTFCNSVTPNGDYQLAAPHNTVSNGAVYKFNKSTNAWTNITPSNSENLQGGFSTIDVSPTDANKIVISTVERWWPADELYFSADGGTNWASTFNSYSYASTWGNSLNKGSYSTAKAPYASSLTAHWTTTVVMNPARNNEVMIGTGFGIFANYNVSGLFTNANSSNTASTTWIFENDGLEETVPLELISPTSGAPLVSAIGDFDGFLHTNLDQAPSTGRHKTSGNYMGTTHSIAFAENVPATMVKTHSNDNYKKGSYSTDGGATWTSFTAQPSGITQGSTGGQIAISPDAKTIVWAPEAGAIAYSTNNGGTWTNCGGNLPNGLKPAADRVNSTKFYAYDAQNSKFYYSTNSGVSFSSTALNTNNVASYNAWQTSICAVFGKEGHVLFAGRENGLYRTINGGTSFTKITTVTEAYKITVGKAAPTGTYPAIFIWGIVGGVNGLFRSDDEGTTWERINDSDHEFARNFNCMTGDPRIYGRIYVGSGGRGIQYGDRTAITATVDIEESSLATSYPNPFSNNMSIRCKGSFQYSVYGVDGSKLESGNASEMVTLGENLAKGTYIIKVQQADKSKALRVVKE